MLLHQNRHLRIHYINGTPPMKMLKAGVFMKNMKKFLVMGGDMRQLYAAKQLSAHFDVFCLGFDKASDVSSLSFIFSEDELPDMADYLLLPPVILSDKGTLNAPLCSRELSANDAAMLVKAGGTVFGGRFPAELLAALGKINAGAVNYLEDEIFNVRNAVPTAEGALKIAIEETSRTICGSRAAVVGFGRIGKVMAKMLRDMGAEVTVIARSPGQLEWAKLMGCDTAAMSMLKEQLMGEVTVFNTVPSLCIGENELASADSRCLIIDLASRPGGVDRQAADRKGVRVIHALGLPGRFSPVTAGEIIAETVLGHIYP